MRNRRLKSDPKDIGFPTCPKCGIVMWLARRLPDGQGTETRTFECPTCDYVEVIITTTK